MEKKKDFRLGHRDRVRARFLREGLAPFADYEVLELLLFYAIPRRDTKGQAHALDDTLGSLYEVLTASEEDLCRVNGIGAHTAKFLRALYPFLEYVVKEEPHSGPCPDDRSLAWRIYPYLNRTPGVTALLAFLNNRDDVICTKQLGEGKAILLASLSSIVKDAYFYGASSVVLADYKGEGIPFPDGILFQSIHTLKEELYRADVHLRDYMMFTEKQYNSLFQLTGQTAFESPSPFFIYPDMVTMPTFDERSMIALIDILSFVTKREKAQMLAERLLTHYRTIENVLALPYTTLLAENEDAASEMFFLKILSEVYARAELSRVRKQKGKYTSARAIGEMLSAVIGTYREEIAVLGMFDKDLNLIDVFLGTTGTVNTVTFAIRTMVEAAVNARATYVAIAHNHPNGVSTPSSSDVAMTNSLEMAFAKASISFIDHFVVTATDYYAISSRKDGTATCMPKEFFEA